MIRLSIKDKDRKCTGLIDNRQMVAGFAERYYRIKYVMLLVLIFCTSCKYLSDEG